jgi:hypothetical protein
MAVAAVTFSVGLLLLPWGLTGLAVSLMGTETVTTMVTEIGNGLATPFYAALAVIGGVTAALRIQKQVGANPHRLPVDERREQGRYAVLAFGLSFTAVLLAAVLQPWAYSAPKNIGSGVGALVIAAVILVLTFGVGSVPVPEASVQRAQTVEDLRRWSTFLRAAEKVDLPSVSRARAVIVVRAALLVVVVPVAFALWMLVGRAEPSWTAVVVATVISCAFLSAYGIAMSISGVGNGKAAHAATWLGVAFAGVSWVALGLFQLWAFATTDDRAWLAYAAAFLTVGTACTVAAWPRQRIRGKTLRAAAMSFQVAWGRSRLVALESLLEQLDQRRGRALLFQRLLDLSPKWGTR